MPKTITIPAELREDFGKGFARRIRAQDKIPAVMYSRGDEPIHVTLPGHETMLALREANVLLTIELPDGSTQLALPKQIQRHPVRQTITHVDLLRVTQGVKVKVNVPIIVVGEPEDSDLLVNHDLQELEVNADPTAIPNEFEVSVEGLGLGTQIFAGDIALPEGVDLVEDAETLVLTINAPISEEALEASLEASDDEDGEVETVAESEADAEDQE